MKHEAVALLLLLGPMMVACGRRASNPSSYAHVGPRSGEARWQDVFESTPELVVVVRPQALRRDKVYGPLLGRAIQLAREHSRLVAATGALDAMLDADEVVVGEWAARGQGPDDLVVVVRGVRAEVNPANLVGDEGGILWVPSPNGPIADVRELSRVRAGEGVDLAADLADASLFELPGRTWVIATGDARARVRDAFWRSSAREHATGPSPLEDDGAALATVRLGGSALVAHVPELRSPSLLAPLGRRLAGVAVVLAPGDQAVVRATLSYKDPEAASLAEATIRTAVETVLGAKPEEYGWLRSVRVERAPVQVMVTVPLPARLVNGLLHPGPARSHPDEGGPH